MLDIPPSVPSAKLQTALLEQRPRSQIIGDGTQNQELVIWENRKWQQLTHWPLGYVEVISESITLKLVIQSSSLIIHNTTKLHSGKYIRNITSVGINPGICVFYWFSWMYLTHFPKCEPWSLMKSQYWFRLWHGTTRQQAITWTSVDKDGLIDFNHNHCSSAHWGQTNGQHFAEKNLKSI